MQAGVLGFVSACCLGKQGKRGMWIERRRGSMTRAVIVFKTDGEIVVKQLMAGSADGEDDEVQTSGNLQPEGGLTDTSAGIYATSIDGRVIREVGSYDLRGEYFL
jgi:hypothetical protein